MSQTVYYMNTAVFLPSTEDEVDEWDFIPHPELNSLEIPPWWHHKHAEYTAPIPMMLDFNAMAGPNAIPMPGFFNYDPSQAMLNPLANTFTPLLAQQSSAPSSYLEPLQPCIEPCTVTNRQQLVYTQRNFMLGPPAPVIDIVSRLSSEIPAEISRTDGSVVLNIQWAIQCIGYGHLERSETTGRAVLKEESLLRRTGVDMGLHPRILQWLVGEEGFEGPTLELSAEMAVQFWSKQ